MSSHSGHNRGSNNSCRWTSGKGPLQLPWTAGENSDPSVQLGCKLPSQQGFPHSSRDNWALHSEGEEAQIMESWKKAVWRRWHLPSPRGRVGFELEKKKIWVREARQENVYGQEQAAYTGQKRSAAYGYVEKKPRMLKCLRYPTINDPGHEHYNRRQLTFQMKKQRDKMDCPRQHKN